METITHEGKIIALVLRSEESFPGVRFFTPPQFSQQLGFLKHKAGHRIQPHTHNRVRREVVNTQEVLLIRRGKVEIYLYTEERRFLTHLMLNQGDIILLASGGHGLEILEDVEMIEVKQGPYLDEMVDKRRFEWP
ncbi:MAG: hypothetical protein ABIG67_09555 [Pseudomonadota bacterium]